jgi:[ribosomal protein S5]-alanine N-acetyltransferase
MVGGYAPRARGKVVRPRRLIGASWRPLNFTVMRHEPTLAYPPEVIDLRRLRLRRPRLSDASAIFEYASDPEVARYADWPIASNLESVMELLRGRESAWKAGSEFYWVLTLLSRDQAIGGIACSVSGHAAEFGFHLSRRFWSQGYATEASRAVVEWVFSVPSLWRLVATCDTENTASARVLEKAGLTLEGPLRRAIVRPNLSSEPRDAFLYSKVRDDA